MSPVKAVRRFKNLLFISVGKARDQSALEQALNLVDGNRGRLTIAEVIPELPRDFRALMTSIALPGLQELIVQERTEQLQQLIAPFRRGKIKVTAKVLGGTPLVEIIREVLRKKHDLVILTAPPKQSREGSALSNTASSLQRQCPCPVFVLKPRRRKRPVPVLAAVDPRPSDADREDLNATIMELGTSLARIESSELHVVHTWRLFGESVLRGQRVGMPASEVNRIAQSVRQEQRRQLEELVGRFDLEDLKHEVHFLKGDPTNRILEVTRKRRVGLIVMGTVCRTGLAGFFIGNTAERVLSQVDCSVLTVKPPGFVSPVTLD